MSGSTYRVDFTDFEKLSTVMKAYPKHAEDAMNKVLHGTAGERIGKAAQRLIHPSGVHWPSHRTSATTSYPFQYDVKSNLAVTVKGQRRFAYLYFPDDGSNTRRHYGGQQFMLRGAKQEQDKIMQMCAEAIVAAAEQ